jgi:hypothetical protein
LTAVLLVPDTLAMNCFVVPRITLALEGETVTLICGGGVVDVEPPPQPLNATIARDTNRRVTAVHCGGQ